MRAQIFDRESLSLDLVEVARYRGFTQGSHVVWLGQSRMERLGAETLHPQWRLDVCDAG